jgi:uncharacterized protein YndB with AHSA1/START domain
LETANDRIEHEVLVNAPMARTWKLLTMPEHVAKWYAFGGAEIDLQAGGRLVFRWTEHGEFHGRVEHVTAPIGFSFRFAGHSPGEVPRPGNATLVAITLEPLGDHTRVLLVESGFLTLDNPMEGEFAKSALSLQGWRDGLAQLCSLALYS